MELGASASFTASALRFRMGAAMKTAPFFLRFNSSDTWLFYETRCPKGNANKLAHIF